MLINNSEVLLKWKNEFSVATSDTVFLKQPFQLECWAWYIIFISCVFPQLIVIALSLLMSDSKDVSVHVSRRIMLFCVQACEDRQVNSKKSRLDLPSSDQSVHVKVFHSSLCVDVIADIP